MKKKLVVIFCLLQFASYGQHNFLGKSQSYIKAFFDGFDTFLVQSDTLISDNLLLTYKSVYQYPYYTYIIDIKTGLCISYGLVSKNTEVLNTFKDLLEYAGTVVKKDTVNHNIIYELKKDNVIRFYDIKQPFVYDENVHRRGLFYIVVRQGIVK